MKKFILFILLIVYSFSQPVTVTFQKLRAETKLSSGEKAEILLKQLSLKEKIDLLSGTGFDTKGNDRLGIPKIRMTDGPAGVRWGRATAFPAPIALAATWDKELLYKTGEVMGKETRAAGRNYFLSPCVNIHRFPLGGRNFESYGEDPFLVASLAVPMIKGIQSQNILASVKHFACNNQEWKRSTVDVVVDERTLHEIYLPAFKAAVQEADVWTVMCSYNKVNGKWTSENPHLLDEILKKEWGFKGFVVSDWGATHSTVASANAGLDLEMPTAEFWGESLYKAVQEGAVTEEKIDDKIKRIFTVMFRANLSAEVKTNPSVFQDIYHKNLAREAAEKSIVLLKNENNILPLSGNIKSVAIIGPNAAYARCGGGGSSMVTPFYTTNPLDAIKQNTGNNIKINYAFGARLEDDVRPVDKLYLFTDKTCTKNGLISELYLNNNLQGKPRVIKDVNDIYFNWSYDTPEPDIKDQNDKTIFSMRYSGYIRSDKSGVHNFEILNNDGVRIYIDDKIVLDDWKNSRKRKLFFDYNLEADKLYKLTVEYFSDNNIAELKFGWIKPEEDLIADAVNAARNSDITIVFAGLSNSHEAESRDRDSLSLFNQDKLIEAVASVNPNTVVVMQTGSPVTMDWIKKVKAVLQAWYGGQEGGNAIASVLSGKKNPEGKLPFSFINKKEDSPSFTGYKDPGLKSFYSEGIYVGYRYLDKNKIEPLFPFGHGLSYSSFVYSELKITEAGSVVHVEFTITNTGKYEASETTQIYVKVSGGKVDRPEKELKGFSKVFLKPGESKKLTISIEKEKLSYFDTDKNKFVFEPADYTFLVGSSSLDIRLNSTINISRQL